MTGKGSYTTTAIRETAAGEVSIRFAAPLVSARGERSDLGEAEGSAGTGRRAVGSLGLLHYLFEEAGLSSWSPRAGRRTWALVAQALGEQVHHCRISGRPGDSVVYIVPPYTAARAEQNLASFDAFVGSLRAEQGQIRRGLLLGEIKAVTSARFGLRYRLAHQSPRRGVIVGERLDSRLRTSYRHPFADAAAQVGGRRVGLFYIERSRGGFPVAVDAALMLTNRAWIPADSSFEVRMADALMAAGRSFVKPLRYDASDAVFPDFVITDSSAPVVVEVWGLPGQEAYEARKRQKRAWYRSNGTELVEWTVTDPLPDLRPSDRRTTED